MKTNILLVCISIFLIQSCGIIEQKQKEKEEERKKFLEYAKAYLAQDSINTIDQYKAIGDIMFGISESSFNEKEKSFLSNFKTETEVYKRGRYRNEIVYNLGDYQYRSLMGSFHNDSLYSIILFGTRIAFDDYDVRMQKQFNILLSILTEKYGEPIINYGFPEWTSIEKESDVKLCFWSIGKKQIEIQIYFDGVNYALWLVAYLRDIKEKVDAENEISYRKNRDRWEREEKERVKRAAEIL